MTTPDSDFNFELSRRKLLAAAGIGGGVVVAASVIGTGDAAATPASLRSSNLVPMIAGPEGGPSSDMQRYEG
jgi:hypothetical protein